MTIPEDTDPSRPPQVPADAGSRADCAPVHLDPAVSAEVIAHLRRNLALEKHTLLVGPMGCGKTTAVEIAARDLGRPFEVFHFGGATDPEALVTGIVTLKDGETVFVRSRFVDAIQVPETVILLDEVNRAGAHVHNLLMGLTDSQARLYLDLEAPNRRVVHKAPGVAFVATANMGAEYTGTEVLDLAFADRFTKVVMGYSPLEHRLLVRRGVEPRQAQRLVQAARIVRQLFAQGQSSAPLSTRGLLSAGDFVANGMDEVEAVLRNVHVYDEAAEAALRTAIRATR